MKNFFLATVIIMFYLAAFIRRFIVKTFGIQLVQFLICFIVYLAAVMIAISGIVLWFHFQLRVVGFFTIIIGIVSTTFSVYLWGRRKHVK